MQPVSHRHVDNPGRPGPIRFNGTGRIGSKGLIDRMIQPNPLIIGYPTGALFYHMNHVPVIAGIGPGRFIPPAYFPHLFNDGPLFFHIAVSYYKIRQPKPLQFPDLRFSRPSFQFEKHYIRICLQQGFNVNDTPLAGMGNVSMPGTRCRISLSFLIRPPPPPYHGPAPEG